MAVRPRRGGHSGSGTRKGGTQTRPSLVAALQPRLITFCHDGGFEASLDNLVISARLRFVTRVPTEVTGVVHPLGAVLAAGGRYEVHRFPAVAPLALPASDLQVQIPTPVADLARGDPLVDPDDLALRTRARSRGLIDEISRRKHLDAAWEPLLVRAHAIAHDFRAPRVTPSQARQQMKLANKTNAKRARKTRRLLPPSSSVRAVSVGLPTLGKKRH